MAVLVSIVGVWSLLVFTVLRRTREFGIRMTLMPCADGESRVVRLLGASAEKPDAKQLGPTLRVRVFETSIFRAACAFGLTRCRATTAA